MEQHKENPWDILYEAAGQVMRLRLNEHSAHGRGLLGPPSKPSPPIQAPSQNSHKSGYYHAPVLTKQQLQAAQVDRFFFGLITKLFIKIALPNLSGLISAVLSSETAAINETTAVCRMGEAG